MKKRKIPSAYILVVHYDKNENYAQIYPNLNYLIDVIEECLVDYFDKKTTKGIMKKLRVDIKRADLEEGYTIYFPEINENFYFYIQEAQPEFIKMLTEVA